MEHDRVDDPVPLSGTGLPVDLSAQVVLVLEEIERRARVKEKIGPLFEPPSDAIEFAEWFARDPEARSMMRFARRAGITFSEAQKQLSFQIDRDAELGFDLFEAEDARLRCPGCGVHPDEIRDPNGRLADEPHFRLEIVDCEICEGREEIEGDLNSADPRPKGVRVVVWPRKPGDPLGPTDTAS